MPSYLGTSAAFVGGVTAIRAPGGSSSEVTGAILVAGAVLLLIGVLIHFLGSRRAARGAAPGGHRCGRHADRLQPRPGRRRHLLAAGPVGRTGHDDLHDRRGRGLPRLHQPDRDLPRPDLRHRAVLAARPHASAQITSVLGGATEVTTHLRWDTSGVGSASWFGFPAQTITGADGKEIVGWHTPTFTLPHPARAARGDRPDRREHRPRQGGRRDDRPRPRPGHGEGASPPTASAPCWPRRSAAPRPRPTPRTSA